MDEKPAARDPIFDAITGHNRIIILCAGLVGMVTGFAASKGLITPNSAIPSFGWVLFGLLVSELAYGFFKKAAPATLVSMPGRILALIVGVGVDILTRQVLNVGW